MNGLWDKIKNSNVVKVATAYGVVCWILLQVQDAILPTIGAPIWVAQIILFLILIGFPIACLIAWASDLTSNNLKTKDDSQPTNNLPKRTILIGSLFSIAIVGLFAFYVSPYVFDYEPKRNYQDLSTSLDSINNNSSKFDLNLGESSSNEWGLFTEISISNSGQYVAYSINKEISSNIYIRDLWSVNPPMLLTEYSWGTDVHGILDFTDDDEWISYFDSGILKKIRITGGSPETVLKTRLGRTSGYDIQEEFVIFTGPGDLLWTKNFETGEQKIIYNFDKLDNRIYRWPQMLPDNQNIIVSSSSLVAANNDSDILLYNSVTGDHETVIPNAYNARFLPSINHIIFVRDSSLWGVKFNPQNLKASGKEVQLVESIQTNGILGSAAYSVSDNGRLVYLQGSDTAVASNLKIDIVSSKGEIIKSLPIEGRFGQVSLSPNSKMLSYTHYDSSDADIWVYDFDKNTTGRRTFNGRSDRSRWDPDGKNIIYTNNFSISGFSNENQDIDLDTNFRSSIRQVSSDGAGRDQQIYSNINQFRSYLLQSVSPVGDELFFLADVETAGVMGVNNSIWSLSLHDGNDSELKAKKLNLSSSSEEVWWARPSISYDGNWIAYISNESGSNQLYIRPYPEINNGKWQVSAKDALSPIWSASSNDLFFHSGNKIYKVKYEIFDNEDTSFFNLSEPELLFEHTIVENHLTFPAWDYDSINDRFIMISTPDSESSDLYDNSVDMIDKKITLTVVEGWFNDLIKLTLLDP